MEKHNINKINQYHFFLLKKKLIMMKDVSDKIDLKDLDLQKE